MRPDTSTLVGHETLIVLRVDERILLDESTSTRAPW
jgi:hypothetical protein